MEWERWRNPNSIRVTSLIINAHTDQGNRNVTGDKSLHIFRDSKPR